MFFFFCFFFCIFSSFFCFFFYLFIYLFIYLFLTIKCELIKQFYNINLRRLPSQHGEISVKRFKCVKNLTAFYVLSKMFRP